MNHKQAEEMLELLREIRDLLSPKPVKALDETPSGGGEGPPPKP